MGDIMKDQWIYRVCSILGEGPYRDGDMGLNANTLNDEGIETKPIPWFRGGLDLYDMGLTHSHFFGFKNKEDLKNWFEDGERIMISHQAVIHKILVKVDASTDVLSDRSGKQIIFNSYNVTRVIQLDVVDFSETFELVNEEIQMLSYVNKATKRRFYYGDKILDSPDDIAEGIEY